MFALPSTESGKQFEQLVAPRDRELVARTLASPEEATAVFSAVRADGNVFTAELLAMPAELPGGLATVIVLRDGGYREPSQISYVDLVDAATNLPNRGAFFQRLQAGLEAMRGSGPPSVVMLTEIRACDAPDIVPDVEVLRLVGARMRRCLRGTDMIARLGPAELGVFLPRVSARSDLTHLAARLLAEVTEETSAALRVNIGIAAYPDDAASADKLLARAGAALDEARRAGGGRFAFASAQEVPEQRLPAYVSWDARYQVGIEAIDGQHRELLELINKLGDGLRSGYDFEQLVESLRELVRYTEHHFATEERLMDELGARGDRHRAEHRRLLRSLMQYTLRLDAEGVSQSAAFLQDWLFRHIDEIDRPFASFLREHGVE